MTFVDTVAAFGGLAPPDLAGLYIDVIMEQKWCDIFVVLGRFNVGFQMNITRYDLSNSRSYYCQQFQFNWCVIDTESAEKNIFQWHAWCDQGSEEMAFAYCNFCKATGLDPSRLTAVKYY